MAEINNSKVEIPTLLTIKQFSAKHKFLSESALRNHIYYSDLNNLRKFNVITKLNKRVYINEINFFKWLENQSNKEV